MKLNKNINYKQKALFSLLSLIVIVFLIFYFFVFSYTQKVSEANQALINHRVEFETKLIKEEKFSKISKNLSEIESDMKHINKTFINEDNKLEFITLLEKLADENSLKLEIKIDFNKIDIKNKSNPISLTLNGHYNNLVKFLVDLENLNYYINVVNISIVSPKNNLNRTPQIGIPTGNSSLTMIVGATTYWQ